MGVLQEMNVLQDALEAGTISRPDAAVELDRILGIIRPLRATLDGIENPAPPEATPQPFPLKAAVEWAVPIAMRFLRDHATADFRAENRRKAQRAKLTLKQLGETP